MIARDRRRADRRVPDVAEALARVRLRTGRELAVVDLSPGGALVEGETRLLPGTHVDVHVPTPQGRELVRSRIVRAYVSVVTSSRVEYRGALAFDRLVDIGAGYALPRPLPPHELPPSIDYPPAGV